MVRSAVLLFGDVCRAIVVVDALGVFWRVTRTASRTLRSHPARMVRSAVLLFGDVCRAIVVVDALGVFWRVTRTASRTLRSPPARMVRSAVLLFGDVCWAVGCGRCVGGFLAGDEDRFTNPTKPLRADGTFRGPFVWRRLLGGWLWSLRWGFFGG